MDGVLTNEQIRTLIAPPQIANIIGVSLDWLREQIREKPEVKALFVKLGPVQVMPEGRIEELKRLLKPST